MRKVDARTFIDLLLENEVVIFSEKGFVMSSGRESPYMINIGKLADENSLYLMGEAYAQVIVEKGIVPNHLHGPAYKGIVIATTTALSMRTRGHTCRVSYDRKEAKGHGEGTAGNLTKQYLIGAPIRDGTSIVLLDDVITDGKSKYRSVELLNSCARNLRFRGLVIAVDRQEVGRGDRSAAEEFSAQMGMPVYSIVTVTQLLEHLTSHDRIHAADVDKLRRHVERYGVKR